MPRKRGWLHMTAELCRATGFDRRQHFSLTNGHMVFREISRPMLADDVRKLNLPFHGVRL